MVTIPEIVGLIYLLTCPIPIGFTLLGLREWEKPGSIGFVVAALGIIVWVLASGLNKFFVIGWFLDISHYAILSAAGVIGVGWFVLAWEYVHGRRLSSRIGLVLLLGFGIMQVLIWTDPIHHGVLGSGTHIEDGLLIPEYGVVFWLNALFGYGLIIGATSLFIYDGLHAFGARRRQLLLLVAATVPPALSNLISILDIGGIRFDFTPFGYIVWGLILVWTLYREQFLSIIPVARKTILEEMQDAVLTLDNEDNLVDFNAEAASILQLDKNDVGRNATAVISGNPTLVAHLHERTEANEEVTIETARGTRHFHLKISSLQRTTDFGGRVIVLRDITQMKERERELKRRNQQLDQFASMISHDLRNPLNVIKGRAALLRGEAPSEHVEPIESNAERMATMIDDLLTLSRAGESVDDPEPVSLATVTGDSWEAVSSDDVDLDVDIPDGVEVDADDERLRHVFENLFRNASEHNDPPVTIRVGTLSDETGSVSEFFVADDGTGIPESDREDVFEYGYTTNRDGTGFGLSIVEEIVEAHGWTISISESEAGGARFEIQTTGQS